MRRGAPVLVRLHAETLREMELASWERLSDAHRCLQRAGRAGAAVYLAGYAAEMALKAACFRLSGGRSADLVANLRSAVNRPARALLAAGALTRALGSGHDLLFWLDYLRYLRQAQHRVGWTAAYNGKLDQHVVELARGWSVDMRYRRLPISASEARVTIGRSGWLVRQQPRLER